MISTKGRLQWACKVYNNRRKLHIYNYKLYNEIFKIYNLDYKLYYYDCKL